MKVANAFLIPAIMAFFIGFHPKSQAKSVVTPSFELSYLPNFIFVKNNKLQTVLCNKVFAMAVGKTPEEMVGLTDIENGWDPDLVKGNPDKDLLKNISTDHLNGGPWIMWPNTPYAHIMVPVDSYPSR